MYKICRVSLRKITQAVDIVETTRNTIQYSKNFKFVWGTFFDYPHQSQSFISFMHRFHCLPSRFSLNSLIFFVPSSRYGIKETAVLETEDTEFPRCSHGRCRIPTFYAKHQGIRQRTMTKQLCAVMGMLFPTTSLNANNHFLFKPFFSKKIKKRQVWSANHNRPV